MTLLAHPTSDAGAKVYTAYCMHCHGVDGKAFAPLLAPPAGNPNVLEKDSSSLISVTLNGTRDLMIQGIPSAYPMPPYAKVLNVRQIADVLAFVRNGWNNGAPAIKAADVAKMRKSTHASQ
jgi:mono/diheme cytochrome c family protein